VCVEQIIDLRNTLRYLGVPVREKSYMFGENESVVDSSMQLNASLHKHHTMLSFHCVREAIAAGILGFYFLPVDDNPADILSKHWGYTQIKDRLKSLLILERGYGILQISRRYKKNKVTFWVKGE
jgi:hypothetical protein